jgi:ADP-ribosylglycohydrolase
MTNHEALISHPVVPTQVISRNPLKGQACGDRIGGPIRMALLLGESLVACRGYDEADLTARYLAWFRTEAFDSGPVWEDVFGLVAKGMPAREAACLVDVRRGGLTAGVNAAHRSTAIGCALATISDDTVGDIARREASLTHHHRDAGEAAAATALIVRALLRGASVGDAALLASSSVVGITSELLAGAKSADLSMLSDGGYAPRVVEAAVYFTATSDSFAEAIVRSISFAGPSNYCPVLVGAFAGANHGVTDVPSFPADAVLHEPIRRLFAALTLPPTAAG